MPVSSGKSSVEVTVWFEKKFCTQLITDGHCLSLETFTLKQKEYGPIKAFDLKDENVVKSEMLEMLPEDVFSTCWVQVVGESRTGLVCSLLEKDMAVFCQILLEKCCVLSFKAACFETNMCLIKTSLKLVHTVYAEVFCDLH